MTVMRGEYEVAEKSKLPTNINHQALSPRRDPLAYAVGYQPFKIDQNQRSVTKIGLRMRFADSLTGEA